ncbi:hypothetical protein T484DRAFT_1854940 [Baffinella frigidus]|nr:hypothetical protein T484DRAFT_1854940 [Cryptophyta sp. CCMP2293]
MCDTPLVPVENTETTKSVVNKQRAKTVVNSSLMCTCGVKAPRKSLAKIKKDLSPEETASKLKLKVARSKATKLANKEAKDVILAAASGSAVETGDDPMTGTSENTSETSEEVDADTSIDEMDMGTVQKDGIDSTDTAKDMVVEPVGETEPNAAVVEDGDKSVAEDTEKTTAEDADKSVAEDTEKTTTGDTEKTTTGDAEKTTTKDGEKPPTEDSEKTTTKDGEKPPTKDGEKPPTKDGEKPPTGETTGAKQNV